MLKALFFCGILTVSMSVDLKREGAAMDITTKKGKQGRKNIDRITVEKGRRGDFSPLQPDHYHSFYEIFYLWSGSCRFLLKDTVYQMEAGDLVCRQPHFHIRAGATAAFLHGQRSRGIPGGAALPADPDAHREFPVRPLLRAF